MMDKEKNKKSMRELFLWSCILFGFFIVFTTEFLSFFGLINRLSIFTCWIILFFFTYLKFGSLLKIYFYNISLKKKYTFDTIFLYKLSISLILILTFLTALIYPPNTPDSLSYHMPRVMHWIQNNNVEFYPTSITRQLFISPFSEYVILHLQLLIDGDYLANYVQWLSMIGSVIGVSLITKEFGGNNKSQLLSSLFCATIPMGILQSNSTQTDYVVTLWIVIFVYFIVRYRATKLTKYIYGSSVALGLAILTKQTAYIFAFPFCIWFLFIALKKPNHFHILLIVPLILCLINFGQYKRNFELFGNPIGIHNFQNEGFTNKKFDIQTLSSNVTRNISFNLMVPSSKVNNITRNFVIKIHDYLQISVDDPKTTFPNEYWTFFSLYESFASNTLHFIIIIFIILMFIIKRYFKPPTQIYIVNIILGFLLFSLIFKWNPWANRYFLPTFVLFAPIIGFGFYQIKSNKLDLLIATLLVISSLPYLLMNETRPLVAKIENFGSKIIIKPPHFFKSSRDELYFTFIPKLYKPYQEIADKIKANDCKIIGIDASKTDQGTFEYALWVLGRDKSNGSYPKIFHYNVKNISNKTIKNRFDERTCAKFHAKDYPIIAFN